MFAQMQLFAVQEILAQQQICLLGCIVIDISYVVNVESASDTDLTWSTSVLQYNINDAVHIRILELIITEQSKPASNSEVEKYNNYCAHCIHRTRITLKSSIL